LLPEMTSWAYINPLLSQGDWLIELPAERTNAPPGWEKVCATKKVCTWLDGRPKRCWCRSDVGCCDNEGGFVTLQRHPGVAPAFAPGR
jgi:hypothetical protein